MIKATDKMLARRADTRARADFATWNMMAKLNGSSSLSTEAQNFLAKYWAFCEEMSQAEATEATIALIVKDYYAEMGGVGTPPELPPRPTEAPRDRVTGPITGPATGRVTGPATDNVTAFRRPVRQPKATSARSGAKPKLPVMLIFLCLAVVYVGLRYYFR